MKSRVLLCISVYNNFKPKKKYIRKAFNIPFFRFPTTKKEKEVDIYNKLHKQINNFFTLALNKKFRYIQLIKWLPCPRRKYYSFKAKRKFSDVDCEHVQWKKKKKKKICLTGVSWNCR